MPKRCVECGTLNRSHTLRCEACGGLAWTEAKTGAFRLLSILVVVVVVALAIWLYWRGTLGTEQP
jgi:predicted nucleic acid-binding Zn ribbon protein